MPHLFSMISMRFNSIVRDRLWARVSVWLFLCMLFAGCEDKSKYSQATPEATIATARLMVEEGKAKRLGDLIYAENPEMRAFLSRTGVLLGNLQKLGVAVQQKFPNDVAKLKADLEDAAKKGKSTSLFGQLAQQAMPRGRRPNMDTTKARDAFDDALKSLLADPYAFLREGEQRLTTEYLTDDSVSLRWDNKPIMAPIGMRMKLGDDGKWYFALPTNIPGASAFLPKTKEEYEILGGLIEVFDNMVVDLIGDVENGRVTSLDSLARSAGEKAFLPAVMVMFAYSKGVEQRTKASAPSKTGG